MQEESEIARVNKQLSILYEIALTVAKSLDLKAILNDVLQKGHLVHGSGCVPAALGTCQEIMCSAYASVMGIQLTKVSVDVKGYLDLRGLFGMDESVPAGFRKICCETSLESPADPETLKKLVQTVESHCPVYDTLARAIEVTGSVLSFCSLIFFIITSP